MCHAYLGNWLLVECHDTAILSNQACLCSTILKNYGECYFIVFKCYELN